MNIEHYHIYAVEGAEHADREHESRDGLPRLPSHQGQRVLRSERAVRSDGMTHAESRARNAAMRAFVAAGGTRREAAEKFGVEYAYAGVICVGLPGEKRGRKPGQVDPKAQLLRKRIRAYVNGGMTRRQAATRFAVHYKTVVDACAGLPTDVQPSADWSSVDWTQRDVDIASGIGRTRERVRQVRKKLGKPPSPHHVGRWVIDNREKISGLTIKEIHRMCPLKTLPGCIYVAMKTNGIPFAVCVPILERIKRDGLREHCVIIDGCWLWPGNLSNGSPSAADDCGSKVYLRRLSWETEHGEDPGILYVKTTCGQARCVNPAHLYLSECVRGEKRTA